MSMVRLYKREAGRYSGRTTLERALAIATVNPSAGHQLIKSSASLRAAEIEAKLQRAADTFRSYRKVSFAERAR
jgi:acyl-CoA reductase-like NAD-dependent aldehyde dehydrogenase